MLNVFTSLGIVVCLYFYDPLLAGAYGFYVLGLLVKELDNRDWKDYSGLKIYNGSAGDEANGSLNAQKGVKNRSGGNGGGLVQ